MCGRSASKKVGNSSRRRACPQSSFGGRAMLVLGRLGIVVAGNVARAAHVALGSALFLGEERVALFLGGRGLAGPALNLASNSARSLSASARAAALRGVLERPVLLRGAARQAVEARALSAGWWKLRNLPVFLPQIVQKFFHQRRRREAPLPLLMTLYSQLDIGGEATRNARGDASLFCPRRETCIPIQIGNFAASKKTVPCSWPRCALFRSPTAPWFPPITTTA